MAGIRVAKGRPGTAAPTKGRRGKRLERVVLAVVVTVTLANSSLLECTRAQQPATPAPATASIDRAELHQALLDLSSPWTVMCIAAHPDDEDGTTLTILRRKHGINTVTLFSTYGEGGQNAVGPELYRELGVIRARETLAASAIQGSEPHFLGLVDFGYSKSATEAFRIWGEREALRRMVLKIRQLRPDVIITNHNTTSGHGHHQATGRLALAAFDAAADQTRFPEQLKQFEPWQAKRLFVRFGFGGSESSATDSERVIAIDPNEYDPVRKKTFAEQALAALQAHSSQGPWPKTVADRLKALKRNSLPLIRYRLVREAQTTPSLPSEAKIFVDGLRLPLTVGSKLAPLAVNHQSLTEFADKREEALIVLLNARKAGAFTAPAEVHDLDAPRFRLMSNRLDRALAVASGVALDLRPGGPLVPGGKTQLTAAITNAGDAEVVIRKLSLQAWGTNRAVGIAGKLPPGTDTSEIVATNPPKRLPLTVPAADHLYDGRFLGEPLVLTGELATEGVAFDLVTELRIPVVPQVEIQRITPAMHVITEATAGRPAYFKISLKNHSPSTFQGQLRLSFSNQLAKASTQALSLAPGENREVTMQVDRMRVVSRRGNGWRQGGTIGLAVKTNDLQPIAQRQIRWAYSDARVTPGLKVGYLPSFDQTLQESLAALGVDATELSVTEILKGALARFQSIIVDNRGYEAHPGLIEANPKLLEYVKNGGNLIVFYHRTNEWNPSEQENRPQLAPYPILLGSERITEEDAPVTLIKREHRLLREPNPITEQDFRGWIQERGLYYPREWAREYEVLLTSNDNGEKPLSGGLLVARYGSGTYIYTSMVWYRQLQAGVSGAYRVFANMISYRE